MDRGQEDREQLKMPGLGRKGQEDQASRALEDRNQEDMDHEGR